MHYLERYKKRVGRGARSQKEFTIKEIERNFMQYLEDSPTAVSVPMTSPEEIGITKKTKRVLCAINDLTVNDKKAYDEKKVLVPNSVNVDVGCYFFWDNCYWIIIFKEHKTLNTYKKFIARRCNQIFKYKVNGVVYDIPVNVENLTMYSDGLADQKYTSQQDSKRMITFGSNPVTRTIKAGTRIMLTGKTVFRITHLNDFEYNGAYTGAEGIIKVLVLQTTLIEEDDLENNIAWNKIGDNVLTPPPFTICGDKKIMIGSKKTYVVNNMSENHKWVVIDNNNVAEYLVNEDNSITITATRNVNNTGKSFDLQLVDTLTSEIIDSKKIQISGFL